MVLIRVPVGIDDHGLAGGLAADDVAGLGELGFEETFDEHPDIVRAWCPATSSSSNTPARATPAGRFRRTREQGELHRALETATRGRQFETYGSGRTDAGVHALGQVVHVDLPTALPADTLIARINDELPHDINVLSAERVAPRFHARHSAVSRRHRYQLSRRRSAFEKCTSGGCVNRSTSHGCARRPASFVGFDFRSFTDDDPEEKSTQVLLQELTLTEQEHLIIVHITGSHRGRW